MIAVDLFAGFGGFTLAAERVGMNVAWAGNHWPLAVDAHAANHPGTVHVCQDLRQADWNALPAFDVLLASPACQGHSQAAQPARKRSRTMRAKHDAMRATAWAVVDCADVTEPAAIVVENVPDFQHWRLFGSWLSALQALGYRLQIETLTASIHADVPQRRARLFVVGVHERIKRTRAESMILDLPATAEPAFGPHIRWTDGRWRDIDDAGDRVRERWAKGRANHGRRFLMQHVTGHPGVRLSEPVRTITTKDQWAAVDGKRYRPLTIRENTIAMGFPPSYQWPAGATRRQIIAGLGNAVPPALAAAPLARVGGLL